MQRLVRVAAQSNYYGGGPRIGLRRARSDVINSISSLAGSINRQPDIRAGQDLALIVIPPTTNAKPGVMFQDVTGFMDEQQNRVM